MQNLAYLVLLLPLLSLGAPVFRRSTSHMDIPQLQDLKNGVAIFGSVINSVYLQGISSVPNLVEAMQSFCTLVQETSSPDFLSAQNGTTSEVVLAVASELKKYGCKWFSALTNDTAVCSSEKLDGLCKMVTLSARSSELIAALQAYKTTQVLNPLTWIDQRMKDAVSPSVLQRIKSIAEEYLEL